MKIFSSEQIKEIDRYTIENEPVSSSELMERAAGMLFNWISPRYDRSKRILILTGPGNNGGDGIVLARLLWFGGYKPEVCHIHLSGKLSDDWIINRKKIETITEIPFYTVENQDNFPDILDGDIVIDAIFGSGLTRPAEGLALEAIRFINRSDCEVISIDVPSGLFCEDNSNNNPEGIIRADITLSFQFPKLSFFFADNYQYTGEWHILPIGLHHEAIQKMATPYYYLEENDISSLLKIRGKFDHKGNFGHGLLVAGSHNKTGAAILAARAALRTGIGLITCHTPSEVCNVIQTALPEAMVQPDKHETIISDIHMEEYFGAIGVGPGIGTLPETCVALYKMLSDYQKPLVLDADALNILGLHKEWLNMLPPGTVLTPHLKEFERITGKTGNGYTRLVQQMQFSSEYKVVVVLKGAHTSVTLPEGRVYFNSSGNQGMATAGSGDVLTGIILSLLAQGYAPENASIMGVYIHGLAGDIAADNLPFDSLIASDIIGNIGNAINMIRQKFKGKKQNGRE